MRRNNMKNCTKCNHKFTTLDRLKSTLRLNTYLQCPNCNSKYKPQLTIYRFIYYLLVFAICFNIELDNFILELIVFALVATPLLMFYDVLPLSFHKYKNVN